MTRVGFTGTRRGMTAFQKIWFETLVRQLEPDEFHHGDCVGADAEAHHLVALSLPRCRIIIHPGQSALDEGDKESFRAYCVGHETRPPTTHFARNRTIVSLCDIIIGTPFETTHQSRGGTWYTLNYAHKLKRRVITIWPDGIAEDSAVAR